MIERVIEIVPGNVHITDDQCFFRKDDVAERTRDVMDEDQVDDSTFYQALGRFYYEYLAPVMTEISADTKRQADKEERTVVKIGNRDIRDAYNTQTRADGYKFKR